MAQRKSSRRDKDLIAYSVIVPMKNEEENIADFVEELEPVMEGLNRSWELICIDDGSTDGTRSVLREFTLTKPYLRMIVFAKNCGQSSAFDAGFRAAKGEYVITIDGDRQNDPRDIPELIKAVDGYDLVCGRRAKRTDPIFKRIISRCANMIRSRLCGDGMQDTGCSLKIYRATCLQQIKMFNGMHRFLPALFAIEGFRTTQVDVNHRERAKGKSKYNIFNRGFRTVTDMLVVMWMRKRSLHYTIDHELPSR